MSNVIGIDFGDAYSCIAVVKNDQPSEVVADSQGERHIPSVVGFYPDVAPLVGREAERRFARFWQSTVFDLKTLLGRSFEDAQALNAKWGFKIISGKKGFVNIEVDNQGNFDKFSPQQIIAKILGKLKETAEEALHQKVEHVCFCIPAKIPNEAREALEEAAKLTGFEKISFIQDSVAAVIAYEQDIPDLSASIRQFVVVDFGASVNVTLIKTQSGLMQVIQTETAPQLSASALEKELMNYFGGEFKRKTGLDYTESRKAIYKLRSECERVKKDLSQMQQSNVQIDGFYEGCDLNAMVTRARFEALTDNLIKGILVPIQTIVNRAGGAEKINGIILSGGNIKIPKVQQYIRQFFGPDINIFSTIDPCDVNARGAAIQASLIRSRNPMLKPKKVVTTCALSIGIATSTGAFVPVLLKDTIVPVKVIKTFGVSPGQTKVFISVYEGEDSIAENNNLLGQFTFNCNATNSTFHIGFILDHHGLLKLVTKTGVVKIDGVKKRLNGEEVHKLRHNNK